MRERDDARGAVAEASSVVPRVEPGATLGAGAGGARRERRGGVRLAPAVEGCP